MRSDCAESHGHFRMCLLGSMEVLIHGRPVQPVRSRKEQWLLALLALRGGREIERAWLAGTLWPDNLEEQALSYLRRALYDLRQAMGVEAKRVQSPSSRTLRLEMSGANIDVAGFDAALRRGDAKSLDRAVTLYRGPLLEGCNEAWVDIERQSRQPELSSGPGGSRRAVDR